MAGDERLGRTAEALGVEDTAGSAAARAPASRVPMPDPGALARAIAQDIAVARLSGDCWRARSSAPALRGPYFVWLDPDGAGDACECAGARYGEPCKHVAAARAAACGTYPVVAPGALDRPADGTHLWQPPRHVAAAAAGRDAAAAARRAAAGPPHLTPRDYAELFPE